MNNLIGFKVDQILERYKSAENFRLVDAVSYLGDKEKLVSEWANLCNDPQVYEIFYKNKLKGNQYSIGAARKDIEWANQYSLSGKGMVIYILSSTGILKGNIILNKTDDGAIDIGYCAASDFGGAMTNALTFVVNKLFAFGFRKILADCLLANNKSINLLNRLGFVKTGNFEDKGSLKVQFQKTGLD